MKSPNPRTFQCTLLPVALVLDVGFQGHLRLLGNICDGVRDDGSADEGLGTYRRQRRRRKAGSLAERPSRT